MPHYRNGAPARIGDLVLNIPTHGTAASLGIVTSIAPSSNACNGGLAVLARRLENGQWLPTHFSPYDATITLGECALVTTETAPAGEDNRTPTPIPIATPTPLAEPEPVAVGAGG